MHILFKAWENGLREKKLITETLKKKKHAKRTFFFQFFYLYQKKKRVKKLKLPLETAISHCQLKTFIEPMVYNLVLRIKKDTSWGECYLFCNV